MISLSALLQKTAEVFHRKGIKNSKRQAEELFCDVFLCSPSELYFFYDKILKTEEIELIEEWTKGRLEGVPLAYLSGKVQFYGCSIEVNHSVLIPRPETEILVDRVASYLKNEELKENSLNRKVLLDLCSGSGCIGSALKTKLPALTVYLSDCSQEAVNLSLRNSKNNGVEVTCLKGDFLTPLKGKKIDYLVCNPPYISEEEYLFLDREVKEYEPSLALIGGVTGLEFYERLAQELPSYFNPGGIAWLEIGYQQGLSVQSLFQNPPWKQSKVENDWAGHNRFFFLEIE